MTRPTEVTIPVKYDADGILDCSSLLIALESALGGRISVTDWYAERHAAEDYPHLSEEERRAVISSIETGEYDAAINYDIRRTVLDEAVRAAGCDPYPDGEISDDEDYVVGY